MSEEKLNFTEKLVFVQSKLNAPKGQVNKFADFKYRSLEDINSAVKPLLAEVGLGLVITDEIEVIGDRFYIKATATISDGKDKLSVTAFAREPLNKPKMDESQTTGSASSYARKYALNGLFLIDDSTDPDSMNNSASDTKKSSSENGLSAAQLKTATNKMVEFSKMQNTDLPTAINKLFPYLQFKTNQIEKLTNDEFGILMNYLNGKQANNQQSQQQTNSVEWGK